MKKILLPLAVLVFVSACGTPKPQPVTAEKEIGPPPDGMVLIPGGFFTMGGDSADESPKHKVWVDPFFLDKTEVTNTQYKKFVDATNHPKPPYFTDPDLNRPDQPVVGVGYYDALAYARWKGMRLPTEAEWERASRGGLEGKAYPWGDEPPSGRCNFAPNGQKEKDGYGFTAPAGSFEPNNYGLYDMAGNVWEWTSDFYDKTYYRKSPEKNPMGPDSGYSRVMRGGSWLSLNPKHLRCSSRLELRPFVLDRYYGFRCAQTP